LPQPVWLPTNGVLAEATGFKWTVPIGRTTSLIKVDQGNRIVDLILRSVQVPDDAQLSDAIAAELASISERLFTRDQIALWRVGSDHVIRSSAN